MLDALRLSVGTLTIVPSGAIAEIDRRTAARAMIIAPLAVIPLAAAVAAGGLARPNRWAAAFGSRPAGGWGIGPRQPGVASGRPGRHRRRLRLGMDRGIFPSGDAAGRRRADGCGGADCRDWPAGRGSRGLVQGLAGALLVGVVVCCSRAALCLTCVRGVPAARGDGLGVAVAGSVPRVAAAGCWLVVLLIMMGAAWLSGHHPISGALATVIRRSAGCVAGLSLHAPVGGCHR